MERIIDLSHPIEDGQLAFPSDPPVRIRTATTVESDGYFLSEISLGSHHGTHVDAPIHFLTDGPALDKIPLSHFCGRCRLVDLAPETELPPRTVLTLDRLKPYAERFVAGDRVLLRTGWYKQYGVDGFYTDFPVITAESAQWIAETGIALLGMDMPTPSMDEMVEVHHTLLGKGIVVVEGLNNLHELPVEFTFIGFPLNLQGRDGSPIRAVAVVSN